VSQVLKNKVHHAKQAVKGVNKSSLGFVKNTYIGEMSPQYISNMSEIGKMRLMRLNKSASKINIHKSKTTLSNKLKRNNYKYPDKRIFQKKLAMLKEDMSKEYEKGVKDIKFNRKEHGILKILKI